VRKFISRVKSNPDAMAQLGMWGLELDDDTVKVSINRNFQIV